MKLCNTISTPTIYASIFQLLYVTLYVHVDLLNFGRASTGAHVLDSMYMNDVMHFTSMRHG